ncbi:hypothetical protein RR48_07573 [Papilio machaon]|uniref:Uncharacterized protein n=1 Tax=Papilio machaon TaxID=76193 RepID=A0A194QNR5_PAPMA|nr:hypothetical protein RR48_07573 [Papilio machaon]
MRISTETLSNVKAAAALLKKDPVQRSAARRISRICHIDNNSRYLGKAKLNKNNETSDGLCVAQAIHFKSGKASNNNIGWTNNPTQPVKYRDHKEDSGKDGEGREENVMEEETNTRTNILFLCIFSSVY